MEPALEVAIRPAHRQWLGGEQCMSVQQTSPGCNSPEFHGWHTVLALELSVFARM
jgi:hypothetical protein